MTIYRLLGFALALTLSATTAKSQTSDNGDGTFTNPVLWADMPDPDVIQVADTFYLVTTSMHFLPGVTIMKSCDLVNWQFAANVVPQIDDDPFFDMRGGNRYGKGQWATALRHWGGRFHVLFTSNTNGTYIYSSPTMGGTWQKTTVYDGPYHPILDRMKPLPEQQMADGFAHHTLYDPGFLVDTDGRVYVVHGNTILYITELDPTSLQPLSPAREIYRAHREGLEGNRPYHIGPWYYIICTYGGPRSGNVQCLRSRSLDGPWEEREVMCSGARMPGSHILQACLIPLKSGETWAMAFLDMGVLGRIPHLVPVNFVDGWPLLGGWEAGNLTLPFPNSAPADKPKPHCNERALKLSDDFSTARLGLQWQFNHNPDNSQWSLTERRGWLRLHAGQACAPLAPGEATNPYVANNNPVSASTFEVRTEAPMLMARNTITQRLFGPHSEITAKVDVSNLKIHDRAGLAVLNVPYGTMTVNISAHSFTLSQTEGNDSTEHSNQTVNLSRREAKNLWLRVEADGVEGVARFAYSVDGHTFKHIGKPFAMSYHERYFVGNRVALFCYNLATKGGYMDVDRVDYHVEKLYDRHVGPGTVLQAEWTDALWRTECDWTDNGTSPRTSANMDVVWKGDGGFIAFNNLDYSSPVGTIVCRLKNVSANHAFVQLIDDNTQQVLGSADIPEPSGHYVDVAIPLHQPLVSRHRLLLRAWNHDWNQPALGEVRIDQLTMQP